MTLIAAKFEPSSGATPPKRPSGRSCHISQRSNIGQGRATSSSARKRPITVHFTRITPAR